MSIVPIPNLGFHNDIDMFFTYKSGYFILLTIYVILFIHRALCQKFPRKHNVMMQFLSSMLRDEGGFDYKKAIVNTIIAIIDENGEAKEAGLSHLCEFIEDCEHTVSVIII